MIGIAFQADNPPDILQQCFPLDGFSYCYCVDHQSEIWETPEKAFSSPKTAGDLHLLQTILSQYLVIFLKVQLYAQATRFHDIHTYDEWMASECQALLLIYDCYFVEIYSKNETLLTKIYNKLLESSCSCVEWIEEHHHDRVNMDIV